MLEEKISKFHIVKRKLPKNFELGHTYLFKEEMIRTIPDIIARTYKNVWIDSNGYAWRRYRFIDETFVFREYLKKNSRLNIAKYAIKKQSFKPKRLENGLYLTDGWSIGYFHWFCDVIQRYYLLNKNDNYVLILPDNYRKHEYIQQSLELLGIKYHFVSGGVVKIQNFITIKYSLIPGNYVEPIIKKVNDLFIKIINQEESNRRIYITRKNSSRRKITNEEQYEGILKEHNFEIYDFDKLTWFDQINICSSATILFSVHGAALTNMLFMKKNATIVEIRHPDSTVQNCYFSLASALQMNYYYLKGKPINKDEPHIANLTLDIGKLESTLKQLDK